MVCDRPNSFPQKRQPQGRSFLSILLHLVKSALPSCPRRPLLACTVSLAVAILTPTDLLSDNRNNLNLGRAFSSSSKACKRSSWIDDWK